MFFAGKKVVYLSLYREGQKIKPIGFLQIIETGEMLKIIVRIKNAEEVTDAKYEIYLCNKEQNIQVGHVMIKRGNGYFEKRFSLNGNNNHIRKIKSETADAEKIMIKLTENEQIIGYATTNKEKEDKPIVRVEAEEKKPYREKESLQKTEQLLWQEPDSALLYMDKWQQILSKYKHIHPFGDERVFVSLRLDELMILPEEHQKLVHNSFLLHGFYNYRHVILGKDYRLGSYTDKCFYLGVPGVYFEREKQVAVMFGFEGFECAGAIEIGKFGYYVKEVSI